MSAQCNDGGWAFPGHKGPYGGTAPGMTLRDWFAGQALCGELADPNVNATDIRTLAARVASNSYIFADAMIAAREVRA